MVMMLVVSVNPVAAVVVRPPGIVISAIVRIPTVIAVWVIAVISRIPVIAIPVRRIADSD